MIINCCAINDHGCNCENVKLEEGSLAEHLQAQKCRARIDHLESADADNLSEWNNTRLKRILVDYMLRMSYYDTAQKLAECNNLQVINIVFLCGCWQCAALCDSSPCDKLQSAFCATLILTVVLFIFVHQDLVDIDVFQEAKKVIDALQNKDVAPALAWCADNKPRLKKSKVHNAI